MTRSSTAPSAPTTRRLGRAQLERPPSWTVIVSRRWPKSRRLRPAGIEAATASRRRRGRPTYKRPGQQGEGTDVPGGRGWNARDPGLANPEGWATRKRPPAGADPADPRRGERLHPDEEPEREVYLGVEETHQHAPDPR